MNEALKKHSQDDINFLEVTQLLDQALNSVDQLQQLNNENDEVDNTYYIDDYRPLFSLQVFKK